MIAEQGHFAGRTKPSATRQGLYICTAEGELLASSNTQDAGAALAMMKHGLERWHQQAGATTSITICESYAPDPNYYWKLPEDGLILKCFVRDLPRQTGEADSRYNLDYVWLTKDEMNSLAPVAPRLCESYAAPWTVVRKIARFHLVDTVRGESRRWRAEEVKIARTTLTVEGVTADQVSLRLEGEVRNEAPPSHEIDPYSGQVVDKDRGMHLRLFGCLRYDRQRESFEKFDVIAIGSRWGGTAYNHRFDDWEPAPIGFAFELASNLRCDRTPPQAIRWDYFEENTWQK